LKESTRQRIIDSARILIAEEGYQKTTVAHIAKHAGIAEATIYDYFQGKEDLMLAIPDLWVKDVIRDLDEQFIGIKGAVNKLRKFLWWFLRRSERDPLDAKIVFLFLKTNANFMNTEVYSNVKNFYAFLIDIFEEGIASGEFRQDLNPYLARKIFIGTKDHIVTQWLLKDRTYSLYNDLEETFDYMIKGLLTERGGISREVEESPEVRLSEKQKQ